MYDLGQYLQIGIPIILGWIINIERRLARIETLLTKHKPGD